MNTAQTAVTPSPNEIQSMKLAGTESNRMSRSRIACTRTYLILIEADIPTCGDGREAGLAPGLFMLPSGGQEHRCGYQVVQGDAFGRPARLVTR